MIVRDAKIVANPLRLVTSPVTCEICLKPTTGNHIVDKISYRADRFGNEPAGPFRFIYCHPCVEAARTLEDGEDGVTEALLHRLWNRMLDAGLARAQAEREQTVLGGQNDVII